MPKISAQDCLYAWRIIFWRIIFGVLFLAYYFWRIIFGVLFCGVLFWRIIFYKIVCMPGVLFFRSNLTACDVKM
jgi:hypothetical protein